MPSKMSEYRRIRDSEGVNAAFEYIAHEFWMATGLFPPGKDDSMPSEPIEVRAERFKAWCEENEDPRAPEGATRG